MANYGHVVFFSLVGGLFSLLGGILLLRQARTAEILAKYATPFAAGALLASVFLDLLKEGLDKSSAETVLMSALGGIVIFFFLERFVGWFHHHHQHEDIAKHPGVSLIVIGDTMHNALDGVAIAASFLVSIPTGIITTVAVAAHEIPQEIGDFGLLLAKGMERRKVLLVNISSALATTLLAVITFALGSADKLPVGVLLGLSAGFLLYIAMSDIIPSIHETTSKSRFFTLQPFMVIIGLVMVGFSINLAHSYIDTGHDNKPQTTSTHQNESQQMEACERLLSNPLPNAYDPTRGISVNEAQCIDAFE